MHPLTDQDFLYQFENCSLPKQYFSHRGHLRVAWLYLSFYQYEIAMGKIQSGIKTYANSLGAGHIYNESLTSKWVELIAKAMKKHPGFSFDEFITYHPELFDKGNSPS